MKKVVVPLFLAGSAVCGWATAPVTVVPVSRAIPSSDVTVLSECRDGVFVSRAVRDRSGHVATAVVNTAFPVSRSGDLGARRAPARISHKDGYVLYEDFEDAPANYVWMPEGWTRECRDSKPHSADDPNLKGTWTVSSYMPHEGKYSARVQIDFVYDDDGNIVFGKSHYQDEWLFTPEFVPGADDIMSFYFGFRPGRTLYNADTNRFDAVNNVTEMYISSDGGASYEKVWDCLDYARSLTTEELWADCGTIIATYINVSMSMADYAGSRVKVAFRYFGRNGESAMIDDFKVGKPDVRPLYESPMGTFFAGTDASFNLLMPGGAIAPTCGENIWENLSSPDSQTFGWRLDGVGGEPLAVSDERHLSYTPHGYHIGLQPVLTAGAPGAADEEYAFGDSHGPYTTAFGGCVDDLFTHTTNCRPSSPIGAATYDIGKYGVANWGVFGGGTKFNERASEKAYLKGYDMVAATGVGQFYQQGAHAYYITAMDWYGENVECDPEAVFTLNLSKVVNGAPTADLYATATAKGSDIVEVVHEGRTIYRLPFRFVGPNGESDKIVIDGSMYAFLDLTDDGIANFEALAQKVPNETGFAYGYYEYFGLFDFGDGDYYEVPEMESMKQTVDAEAGPLYCSYLVQTDATYTWLHADEVERSVPADGGVCEFEISSYTPVSEWRVSAPEWLSCEPVVRPDGSVALRVAAAPAPSGARAGEVNVSVPASSLVLTVRQGDSGVGSTVCDTGGFVVVGRMLYAEGAGTVRVYTPSGVEVLSAGTDGVSPVSLAGLPAGIYIVRSGAGVGRVALR